MDILNRNFDIELKSIQEDGKKLWSGRVIWIYKTLRVIIISFTFIHKYIFLLKKGV